MTDADYFAGVKKLAKEQNDLKLLKELEALEPAYPQQPVRPKERKVRKKKEKSVFSKIASAVTADDDDDDVFADSDEEFAIEEKKRANKTKRLLPKALRRARGDGSDDEDSRSHDDRDFLDDFEEKGQRSTPRQRRQEKKNLRTKTITMERTDKLGDEPAEYD